MTGRPEVRRASLPADLPAVQRLCWDYRDHLGQQMPALMPLVYPEESYAALMDALAEKYGATGSDIIIAHVNERAVACGMYHALSDTDAEIKRVFVAPEGRGTGIGEALSLALIDAIRADGYQRVLLDTHADFISARRLYEKLGFRLRGPYSDVPPFVADKLVFYELNL